MLLYGDVGAVGAVAVAAAAFLLPSSVVHVIHQKHITNTIKRI